MHGRVSALAAPASSQAWPPGGARHAAAGHAEIWSRIGRARCNQRTDITHTSAW